MVALHSNSDAAALIIRALNLPKNTYAFTLKMRAGEIVTVEVESYADPPSIEALAPVLKRYRLAEIED